MKTEIIFHHHKFMSNYIEGKPRFGDTVAGPYDSTKSRTQSEYMLVKLAHWTTTPDGIFQTWIARDAADLFKEKLIEVSIDMECNWERIEGITTANESHLEGTELEEFENFVGQAPWGPILTD